MGALLGHSYRGLCKHWSPKSLCRCTFCMGFLFGVTQQSMSGAVGGGLMYCYKDWDARDALQY